MGEVYTRPLWSQSFKWPGPEGVKGSLSWGWTKICSQMIQLVLNYFVLVHIILWLQSHLGLKSIKIKILIGAYWVTLTKLGPKEVGKEGLPMSSPHNRATHVVGFSDQPLFIVQNVPDATDQLHRTAVVRVLKECNSRGHFVLLHTMGHNPLSGQGAFMMEMRG
jgi:hypothetical protein